MQDQQQQNSQEIDLNFLNLDKWKKLLTVADQLMQSNETPSIQELHQNCLQLFSILKIPGVFSKLNKNQIQFFQNTLFKGLLKNIFFHSSFDKQENYFLVEEILLELIKLINHQIDHDIPQTSEIFKEIFSVDKFFYNKNNQDNRENPKPLGYIYVPSEGSKTWRESLKPSDVIDAVKVNKVVFQESGTFVRLFGWSRALIVSKDQNLLKVQYLNDGVSEETKNIKEFEINSPEIGKLGESSTDYAWRMNLKDGDYVDYFQNDLCWVNTVVQAFRIGQPQLNDNIKFSDMSQKYQEQNILRFVKISIQEKNKETKEEIQKVIWINVTDPIIQQSNRITKLSSQKLNVQTTAGQFFYDFADIRYDNLYKKKKWPAAIIRQVESQSCSITVNKLINEFHKNGGFNKILERIKDKQKWVPFQILVNFISGIGQITQLLSRQFVNEFIPELWKEVKDYFENAPISIVRQMDIKASQEFFDIFQTLLVRVLYFDDVHRSVEEFKFKISVKFIGSGYLTVQQVGLKLLSDLIESSQKEGALKYLTKSILIEKLKELKIFEMIINQNTHSSLITKSKDIFKFMMKENMIQETELSEIWELKKQKTGHLEEIKVIFNLLGYLHLPKGHIAILINVVRQQGPDFIINEDIDELLTQMADENKLSTNPNFNDEYILLKDFMYEIIQENKYQVQQEVQIKAKELIIHLLKNRNADERYEEIKRCMHGVETNKQVTLSLQLTKGIIDIMDSLESKKKMITTINEQFKVGQLIKNNIRFLKNVFKNAQQKADQKNQVYKNFCEKYIQKLEVRLNFISSVGELLGDESDQIMNVDILEFLWEELVTDSAITREKELFFNWFQNITKKPAKNQQEIIQFFINKMQNEKEQREITRTILDSFLQLIFDINIQQQNIVEVVIQKKQKNNMYDKPEKKLQEKEERFKFLCQVEPTKFFGIEIILQIVENCNEEQYANEVANFIAQVFMNLNQSLEQRSKEIREEFLQTTLEKLKEFSKNLSQTKDSAVLERKIRRCLLILKVFMKQSEKAGQGGFVSHSGMIRGGEITLQIQNEYKKMLKKKYLIPIRTNQTVFELKQSIGKIIDKFWDVIAIQGISQNENSSTIGDLRLKNNQNLLVFKGKQKQELQRVELVNPETKKLNEKPRKMFEKWFYKYSKGKKAMEKIESCKFVEDVLGITIYSVDVNNSSVEGLFKYNKDNDGLLKCEEFVQFYEDASTNVLNTVWKNILQMNVNEQLNSPEDIAITKVDKSTLPRYILHQNQEFYDLLFNLLQSSSQLQDLKQDVWSSLQHLPTNKNCMDEVISLKMFKNNKDRQELLKNTLNDNYIYKFYYNLIIMEYLLDQNYSEEEENKGLQSWPADFVREGGFEFLFDIFNELLKVQSKSRIQNSVFLSIQKIINKYLCASLTSTNQIIYQIEKYTVLSQYSLQNIEVCLQDDEQIFNLKLTRQLSASTSLKQDEIQQIITQKVNVPNDFTTLVGQLIQEKQLREGIVNKIQNCRVQILNDLMNLVCQTMVNSQQMESEERQIIDFSQSMIVVLVITYDDCLKTFLKNEQYKKLLIEGLFYKGFEVFSHSLYLITRQKSEECIQWLINSLINNIPKQQNLQQANDIYYKQYFDLLSSAIQNFRNTPNFNFSYETFLFDIIQCLKDHESTEKRQNMNETDQIMKGFLQLIEGTLISKPELCQKLNDFAIFIFDTCLFNSDPKGLLETEFNLAQIQNNREFNPKSYVKCKSVESRKICINILLNIMNQNQQCLSIIINQCLLPLVQKVQEIQELARKEKYRNYDGRSELGYMGLVNLGAICYINSLLQQLFQVSIFRNLVMAIDDGKEEDLKAYDGKARDFTDTQYDDNEFHQIQKIFTNLQFSDRDNYNIYQFCHSFKKMDWETMEQYPINPLVQQDSSEFLGNLIEKVETTLKGTPFKRALNNIFGIETIEEYKCETCGFIHPNKSTNVSAHALTVKEKKNIYEGLALDMQIETLELTCESDKCNKTKQSHIRKKTIHKLPNNLNFCLNRFETDYNTNTANKINNRFEFYQRINLKPYCYEGNELGRQESEVLQKSSSINISELPELQRGPSLVYDSSQVNQFQYNQYPQEYYEYKLKGVLIHTGNLTGGHYYSYINVGGDKWLEFNDTIVRDFDINQLGKECFGEKKQEGGWNFEKDKSAYLLFYERDYKNKIELVCQDEQEKQKLIQQLGLVNFVEKRVENEIILEVEQNQLDKFLGSRYYNEVWLNNHNFMIQKQINLESYNREFLSLVKNILNKLQLPNDYDNRRGEVKESETCDLTCRIYTKHQQLTQEQKNSYIHFINYMKQTLFAIFAKGSDSKNIQQILNNLFNCIDVVPTYTFKLLQEHYFQNYENTLKDLISEGDEASRAAHAKLIVYLLFQIIEFYDLKLLVDEDSQEKQQYKEKIVKFFEFCLSNETFEAMIKNNRKVNCFIQIFKDFMLKGEKYMLFLLQRQFLAKIGDLYLGEDSPLKGVFSQKKSYFDVNYDNNPNLVDSLSYTTNYLQQKSLDGSFKISEQDAKMIQDFEFYKKSILYNTGNEQFKILLENKLKNNLEFSKIIGENLLNQVHLIVTKQYFNDSEINCCLNSIDQFLSLDDSLKQKRLEMILGYPEYKLLFFKPENMYNNKPFTVSFVTTLDTKKEGLLSLLLLDKYATYKQMTMRAVKRILVLMKNFPHIFNYVYSLPDQYSVHKPYVNWMRKIRNNEVQNLLQELNSTRPQRKQKEEAKDQKQKVKFQIIQWQDDPNQKQHEIVTKIDEINSEIILKETLVEGLFQKKQGKNSYNNTDPVYEDELAVEFAKFKQTDYLAYYPDVKKVEIKNCYTKKLTVQLKIVPVQNGISLNFLYNDNIQEKIIPPGWTAIVFYLKKTNPQEKSWGDYIYDINLRVEEDETNAVKVTAKQSLLFCTYCKQENDPTNMKCAFCSAVLGPSTQTQVGQDYGVERQNFTESIPLTNEDNELKKGWSQDVYNGDNDQAFDQENLIICPDCQEQNQAGLPCCTKCQTPLNQDIPFLKTVSFGKSESIVICRFCQQQTLDSEYCSQCNQKQ